MESTNRILTIAAILLCCGTTSACTPVATLIFVGGTLPFGALLFKSVFVLFLAIALKSILFAQLAAYGPIRGTLDMAMGNIVSTVPGVIIAGLIASTSSTFIGLGIAMLFIGAIAGRLVSRLGNLKSGILGGFGLAGLTCFAMFISYILFMLTENMNPADIIADNGIAVGYWVLKYIAVFFGLLVTLVVSGVFEGAVILFMHRRDKDGFDVRKVLGAVVRANLWTLFLLSVAGALYTLPTRLQTGGFLFIE